MNQERILEQLDKMVATGRVTEDEAAALRATSNTEEFERAMGAIRARHASEHMQSAITAGEMTPKEADGYLDELRRGEHPTGLRARLSKHRRGRRPTAEGSP